MRTKHRRQLKLYMVCVQSKRRKHAREKAKREMGPKSVFILSVSCNQPTRKPNVKKPKMQMSNQKPTVRREHMPYKASATRKEAETGHGRR